MSVLLITGHYVGSLNLSLCYNVCFNQHFATNVNYIISLQSLMLWFECKYPNRLLCLSPCSLAACVDLEGWGTLRKWSLVGGSMLLGGIWPWGLTALPYILPILCFLIIDTIHNMPSFSWSCFCAFQSWWTVPPSDWEPRQRLPPFSYFLYWVPAKRKVIPICGCRPGVQTDEGGAVHCIKMGREELTPGQDF